MPSNTWNEIAAWPYWATPVCATVIVVLVTATLIRRCSRQASEAPKSLTLRIDGIPTDHADELFTNLRSIAERSPVLRAAAATMALRSLAQHGKDSVCATISTTTSLSGDDLSAQLRRAGNSHPYRYTCKFEGITPLYEDKNGADADIIAVPGLGSHALGSWKSPNSDDVWLRDFLPKDVSNIRVLIYGYDTKLPGSLSKQSIRDLGRTLLEQINAFRGNDGTARRPIIFIGHSLGGLLIKEALIRARRPSNDVNSDLSKACYGLLFFGVPNLGLRNDQLRTLVQGQPNQALIDDLLVDNDSEPSTFLKTLAEQFSESCKGSYRVVTFFERALSPTLKLDDRDGRWRKTGDPSLLVTEKSATGTGLVAVADEDNIPFNTDHSGLVKYSRGQPDYTVVRERLKILVNEAKLEVTKRFAEHSLYQPQSETTLACLRSLAFDDMDGRPNEIDNEADGTCKRLLKHETLVQWTRQHRGLLWINGKPGSGKSTLIKYALRTLPSLYGTDTLAFSFFFHGGGHELQRTPLGLFRSILHQLLKRVPGALPNLIDHFDGKRKTEGEPGEKWQWHLQHLQDFLKSALKRILKRFPVILFIDALDECGEQPARELIGQLKDLLSSLPSTDSRFGICFSCRHYPILELDGGLTIRLDTENTQDIVTFVQAYCSRNRLDADVGRLIISRAQGVSMWAHLVLKQVLQLDLQGESTAEIEAEIERIPPDLNGIYNELIKAVKHRSTTLQLMQWICCSTRPLTTGELQWAMAVDPDCTHKSLDECQTSGKFIANDKINRRINTLSCGLAEVVQSDNARVVQFIHQSVKDFFVEGGLMALDNTIRAANLVVPTAHCRLSRSCVRYFRMAVSPHPGRFSSEDKSRFPLLHYATTSWVSHVKLGEPAEVFPNDLLDVLGRPMEGLVESWVRTYKSLEPYAGDCPSSGSSVVHIVARHGLTKLLSCLLLDTGKVDVDARDEYGRTPLSWAAAYGHEVVVKMLLDTGKVDI
ncbi:ankyrin repeat-containing protein, partial [Microdochium trichocladiopsis]